MSADIGCVSRTGETESTEEMTDGVGKTPVTRVRQPAARLDSEKGGMCGTLAGERGACGWKSRWSESLRAMCASLAGESFLGGGIRCSVRAARFSLLLTPVFLIVSFGFLF